MKWIEQNKADALLFNRIDLSALDTSNVQDDRGLVESIDSHNRAATEITARFARLAEDRLALSNVDNWFAHHAEVVAIEQQRVVLEAWDALVALRMLLADRDTLLQGIDDHLTDKITVLAEQQEEALYNAHQSLERQHREYLKAEPVHGAEFIAREGENDKVVVALGNEMTRLEHHLQSCQSLRHRNEYAAALTFRQREVYLQLN